LPRIILAYACSSGIINNSTLLFKSVHAGWVLCAQEAEVWFKANLGKVNERPYVKNKLKAKGLRM
jgi:hypothetical protein